jgi:hypothetical protein
MVIAPSLLHHSLFVLWIAITTDFNSWLLGAAARQRAHECGCVLMVLRVFVETLWCLWICDPSGNSRIEVFLERLLLVVLAKAKQPSRVNATDSTDSNGKQTDVQLTWH